MCKLCNYNFNPGVWKKNFQSARPHCQHVNVRELQFTIVHFIYFTDSVVSKFDNTVSPTCSMCIVETNLFHTFYHGTPVNKFWAEMSAWHHRITNKFNN